MGRDISHPHERHTIPSAMDSEPSVCERNGLTPNTPTVCEPTHVKNMNMNKEVATRLFPMLMLLPEVVATPPETIAMSADCEMSEANVKPVADMSSTTNVCSRFS